MEDFFGDILYSSKGRLYAIIVLMFATILLIKVVSYFIGRLNKGKPYEEIQHIYKRATRGCFAVFFMSVFLLYYLSGGWGCGSYNGVKVGDHIYFGSYPQTADGTVQPIEWRVIEIKHGKALMISEHLLDCRKYNETDEDVTWETCTLRKWLNDDYYNTAFSEDEQKKIVVSRNRNPDNSLYGTEGGSNTDDHVFLLSYDRARKDFSDKNMLQDGYKIYPDLMAKPTAYAANNAAHDREDQNWGTGRWWLRSPGSYSDYASIVEETGLVSSSGNYVSDDVGYIRPVILYSLSDEP